MVLRKKLNNRTTTTMTSIDLVVVMPLGIPLAIVVVLMLKASSDADSSLLQDTNGINTSIFADGEDTVASTPSDQPVAAAQVSQV